MSISRRDLIKGALVGLFVPLHNAVGGTGVLPKDFYSSSFRINDAMWSWWTKPIVLRDYGKNKNKTYVVFTQADGAVGLAVVDHKKRKITRHIISTAFTPDDHNAGCVVAGDGRVAVFMQGRNIVGHPGDKMFYVEFGDGENPSGLPLKSFDFATAPNRSNYPNAYNSDNELFVLSRNQQAIGNQWNYVLGTWPLTTFQPPKPFFASQRYTWPYFSVRRSTEEKSVFNFALGWHPFDGKHHDIYFGQINRYGRHPWDVVSGGKLIGNMTTGVGMPFTENNFELVFKCPDGYSTRLFDVSDDTVAFALFNPSNNVAEYYVASKESGQWVSSRLVTGGMPFHGTGVRNYYGGMAISERDRKTITVAREYNGAWFVEEYQQKSNGQWKRNYSNRAPEGNVWGRPMEEVPSEQAFDQYRHDLISASWMGTYDPNDYTKFNTTVLSTRNGSRKRK